MMTGMVMRAEFSFSIISRPVIFGMWFSPHWLFLFEGAFSD
jgi:hypothetical protein